MFVACGIWCPTGDKHTILTLLIKPIFSVLAHAEKQFFSKLVFKCLSSPLLRCNSWFRLHCTEVQLMPNWVIFMISTFPIALTV